MLEREADEGRDYRLLAEILTGLVSGKRATERAEQLATDWGEYLVAQGSKIKTYLNGQLCVDLDDAKVSQRGVFGLQIHSGGPMEVRFKVIKLEVITPKP